MKNIMIVDDEPLTRYALRKLISTNFDTLQVIEEVDNGIDAVEYARRLQPDIIFMDIKMPGLNGIEASEKILETNPSIHIIILTAYDHFDYIQKALEIGVEGYLLKPISKDIVARKIDDIVKRIQLNEDKLEARKTLEKNVDAVVQLAERDFIDQLVQNVYDKEIVKQYKSFLEFEMSYGYFICLSFEEEQSNYYNSTIIRERTRHKIEMAISRYLPFMTKFIQASPRGNCIILFLYDTQSTSYNQPVESVMIGEHLRQKLDLVENVRIKVGIGRAYQEIEACHNSFEEAYNVLLNINVGEVIHVENLAMKSQYQAFNYPIGKIEELKEKVQLGSTEDAYKLLDVIIEEISIGQQNMSLAKEYFMQLYFDLRHIMVVQGLELLENDSHLLIALKQTVLMEEVVHIIKMESEQIIKNISDRAGRGQQMTIERIYNYLHMRYSSNVTLDDVAGEIGKTSQYTSKIFKELFGVNFVEYLANIRIEEAKHLLSDSNLRIKEIANSVGYDDANYFCRIFKKKLGMTPKEFRRL